MAASIDGLGSGLDVSTIISQLMSIEKQPQQRLVAQRATVLSRGTAWTSVETQLTALKSALATVTGGGLSATTATSSDPTTATISGTPTAAGVHTLVVDRLATAQRVTSGASTSTTIGAGSLTFDDAAATIGAAVTSTTRDTGTYKVEVLSVTGGVATVRVGTGTAVEIDATGGTVDGVTLSGALKVGTATVTVARTAATDSTLADLATKVNSAGGALTAVVVSDGGSPASYRLVLSGSRTGDASNVALASTFTGALADAELDQTAGTGTDPLAGTTRAVDAQVTFNGIAVQRSTNAVTDLVPGATINLVDRGSTTLTVSADSATSVANGKALVDALNGVLKQISGSAKYDQATKKAGPLTGDGAARALSRSLTDAVAAAAQSQSGITLGGATATGATYTTPNLGISMQKDGTYAFDSAAFEAALRDHPADAKAFMAAIATELGTVVTAATATDGVVKTSKTGVDARAAQLQKQVDAWDDRLTMIENRLRRQFTALDTALGTLRSQGSWLASQIAGLPSGSSS